MTVTMSYGFVGLGLMGLPMAANLARSLDSGDRLYVFDVVQTAIDKLAEQFPTAVEKATSAREVAERSVSHLSPKRNPPNLFVYGAG